MTKKVFMGWMELHGFQISAEGIKIEDAPDRDTKFVANRWGKQSWKLYVTENGHSIEILRGTENKIFGYLFNVVRIRHQREQPFFNNIDELALWAQEHDISHLPLKLCSNVHAMERLHPLDIYVEGGL